MVNNDNKFNGPTVYIQVINNYNFTAPAVIPETVPKKDKVSNWKKIWSVLQSIFNVVKVFVPLLK